MTPEMPSPGRPAVAPSFALPPAPLPNVQNEIEPDREAVARIGDAHQQLAAEHGVAAVLGLVRKIELRGEKPAARRLHLEMIVPRPAAVERRHDGAEAKCAVAAA